MGVFVNKVYVYPSVTEEDITYILDILREVGQC